MVDKEQQRANLLRRQRRASRERAAIELMGSTQEPDDKLRHRPVTVVDPLQRLSLPVPVLTGLHLQSSRNVAVQQQLRFAYNMRSADALTERRLYGPVHA